MADAPAPACRIDGKAFAEGLRGRVAAAAARLRSDHGVQPGLAVVIVGEDPASQIYVRNKGEQTAAAGMRSDTHRLAETTSQAELLDLIGRLNADPGIHGILVQMPLPGHIDSATVLDAIDPAKDVDGFHVLNVGRLAVGLPALTPCTPQGAILLLRHTLGDLSGLEALVVGRSNIVGKPMAQLLLAENCTVTIAHSRSRDLPTICRRADILVAAVGK
ncbi:MAG: tetrahydrofolate dehydrogenase/cyclohydrolase catalytic domain-containing protein, partial [Brevundimonas sp.]